MLVFSGVFNKTIELWPSAWFTPPWYQNHAAIVSFWLKHWGVDLTLGQDANTCGFTELPCKPHSWCNQTSWRFFGSKRVGWSKSFFLGGGEGWQGIIGIIRFAPFERGRGGNDLFCFCQGGGVLLNKINPQLARFPTNAPPHLTLAGFGPSRSR